MRALAAELGVSHQRIGRWLRGESLGAFDKRSPRFDPFASEGLNIGFKAHARACERIANRHGIPFDPELPVYWHLKPRKDGKLGDRVFAEHTQWIGKEMRMWIFERLRTTGLFAMAQIGSEVDLVLYFDQADERQGRKRRNRSQEQGRETLRQRLENGETRSKIYTKRQDFGIKSTRDNLFNLEELLRIKHEPATGGPGTSLASSYVLQLMPLPKDEKPNASRSRAGSRSHIRGRGNK